MHNHRQMSIFYICRVLVYRTTSLLIEICILSQVSLFCLGFHCIVTMRQTKKKIPTRQEANLITAMIAWQPATSFCGREAIVELLMTERS